MSEPRRVLLLGATGLVGRAVMAAAVGRHDLRLTAVARREVPLPPGARMEMLLSGTDHWPDAIAAARAETALVAIGTTIAAVGGDRAAFRAVDHDLVLACAAAAREAGMRQLVLVSSVGADRGARNFYLAVKGEVEESLARLRFDRLDLVRPGLLRGARQGPLRSAEAVGQVVAPLADPLLRGSWTRFRSIRAARLAEVLLALAGARANGRFVHHHDDFARILRR